MEPVHHLEVRAPETAEGLSGGELPARDWTLKLGPLQALGLVLAVAGVYAISLNGKFLWDDAGLLFLKAAATQPANATFFAALRSIWTGHQVDFFPVTSTLFLIESSLFRLNFIGYHVITVALHACAVVLLWRVLQRLGVRGAWLGALLFAIHPVGVESVAWISETKNTLCLAFYAGALLAFLRFEERPGPRRYLLALALFVLALLAKTAAVMLPFVLLLFAWWQRDRITRREIVRILPFFAVSLVLGLVTIHMSGLSMNGSGYEPNISLAARTLNAGRLIFFYLGKALLPQHLMTLYPRFPTSSVLPDLALIALMAVLWVWRGHPQIRAAFFALAYFVLSLVPVLGLINMAFSVYTDVADRFQYLGLIGITALAGAAIVALRFAVPIAAILVAGLAWSTILYERPYQNEELLWKRQLQLDPNCVNAYEELGNLLMRQNRFAEAYTVLQQGVFLDPNNAYARFDLGQLFLHVNRPLDAVAQFQAAQRILPRWATAAAFVGRAEGLLGRLDEAVVEFRSALRRDPQNATFHRDLGIVLARQNHPQEAGDELREALRLDSSVPDAQQQLDKLLKSKE